jgi:hypothetical protein
MTDPALVPLLRELAADGRIVDELVEAARASSPEVSRLPLAENRRHVAVILAAGLAAFERPAHPGPDDFAEATRLGADRAAQGVPIGALLGGVQAGRGRALEIAIARGRAAGIADDVLLEGLLDLDRYTSALERHVIDGYHAAELELARTRRDQHIGLLRRVLLGEPVEPAELTRFGLRTDLTYHCVVAGGGEPVLERDLVAAGGMAGVVEGRLAGLTPRLPRDRTPAVPVVYAPAAALDRAPDRYRLCVAAVRAAGRFGRRGLLAVADLAGETAVAEQPALGRLLSETLLGRLDRADEFHRELALTALAYLDHGQRLDRTAAALHVHPNTVRYRLGRLHDLAGLPSAGAEPDARLSVPQTMRWWWALHDWLGPLNI